MKILTGTPSSPSLFTPGNKQFRLFLFLLLTLSFRTFSQVSTTYTWTYATAAHSAMAGGTTLASGTAMDDAIFTNIPVGFTFNFNGVDYTTVGVSTNGFIWFGTTSPSATEYNPISSTTAMEGVASVFGANMIGRAAASSLKYNTTGTCPNRVFMVQWLNMKVVGKTSQIDMQLTLTEGTNQVELHPYDAPYFVSDKFTGQVGLRGNTNADFKNRSVVSCTNNWNTSTAGATNAVTCQVDGVTCSTYPPANARYRFANGSSVATLTWNGGTDSDWFNPLNWTPAAVPTSYSHVTIPSGLSNYPVLTGSQNAFCRNLTLAAGASLTTAAGYSATLTASGNIANDGSIINNATNYMTINGTTSNTISGSGDFTSADLFLSGNCATYAIANNSTIRKVNIGTGATLNMNTFNLKVLTSFIQTGTINQSTGILQIEDPAPTLTNATFTEATGTTYFAIGTTTAAGNQVIPSITYYNLKVNTNNGFTASIGNGSTVTCTNLVINNPAAPGGIAQAVNAVTVNGNFDLAPAGNTPTLNLSANITVAGIMTLYLGVINTAANKIIINNSSAAAIVAGTGNTNYTLSYINGNLRRMIASGATGNYDFPMGDASNPRYAMLMDNALSGGGFTFIDAYFGALANHSDAAMTATEPLEPGITYDHICVEGVWFLEPDNQPAAGTYDLKAFINAFAGLSDDQYAILKRPANSITGADWTNGGPTPYRPPGGAPGRIIASGYALRSGLSSFSQFGIASHPLTPLPIELLSFTGKISGAVNVLEWITATEINNDHFTVERSANGSEFTAIGTIAGAGNSTQVLSYFLRDEAPLNGLSYYRLKQLDFDGQFSYSNIIALDRDEQGLQLGNVYTAANGQLEVTLVSSAESRVQLELYDMLGKKVYASAENIAGKTTILIPLSALSEGIYMLKAITQKTTVSRKIKH